MKKILSIALVALLAVSSVFAADFSGSASLKFGYDFETTDWGFANSQSKSIDIKAEILSRSAESIGEGDIYAGISASFTAKYVVNNSGISAKFDPAAAISKAYITNGVWNVSILGAMDGPDYAKSAMDKVGSSAVSYKAGVVKAPGFTVTVADYTAAFGIKGNAASDTVDWSAYIATPAYTLAEGLTAKFAAAADEVALGASTEVKYAEMITVQADFGYAIASKSYDFDVAAKIAYDPVTLNAYYNYGENLLSAKAVVKLLEEDALTLTATAKDILNTQDLSAEVSYSVNAALSVTANGGFKVADKSWNVGGSATYTAAAFIAKAGVNYKTTDNVLTASASIESSTIIPGATLKLAYAPSKDSKGILNGKYGAIDATCTIAF